MEQEDQRKNKEYQAKRQEAFATYKENALLFMPTKSLLRYIPVKNSYERKILTDAVLKLAKAHPFVGGLLFEPALTDKGFKKEYKLPHRLDIPLKGMQIINLFLKSHSITIGALCEHNARSKIEKIVSTPLSNLYGTARMDKVREFLVNAFNIEKETEELEIATASYIDEEDDKLSVVFNLTADLQKAVKEHKLTNEDIGNAINGSLKRGVRRAFLAVFKSAVPTAEAEEMLDSKKPVSVDVREGQIRVKILLKNTIKGAFEDGIIKPVEIDTRLAAEIVYGIHQAAAMKAHHG